MADHRAHQPRSSRLFGLIVVAVYEVLRDQVTRAAVWAHLGELEQALTDLDRVFRVGTSETAVAVAALGLTAIVEAASGEERAPETARRAAALPTRDARASWLAAAAAAATGQPVTRPTRASGRRFAELAAVERWLPPGWLDR